MCSRTLAVNGVVELARPKQLGGEIEVLEQIAQGEVECVAAQEARLSVTGREICLRPVLRQIAGGLSSARRSSAWRHRKSAASSTSPGSSMTRSVSGGMWSRPVAGQRSAAR